MKEYVRWIKENYPHIDIVIGTNGVAFDEDWLALTEKYHLLINYSLNAVKQETYDQILVSGDAKEIFGKINDHFHALLEIHNRSERPVVNEVHGRDGRYRVRCGGIYHQGVGCRSESDDPFQCGEGN